MGMAENRPIGIGIIGAGFMCKAHTNAYKTAAYMYYDKGYIPRLRYVGAATEEEARITAARYGYEKYCAGWDDIMMDDAVDVVDVCLSDSLHKQATLDAVARGKHVLCEKPLALSASDAKEMWKAADKAGVKHMCGFNYRFVPAVRLAKMLIEAGVIGRTYSFRGEYCQDPGADPYAPVEKVWYASGPKASGVARGIGSHLIDMSRFLMGEIVSVGGKTMTYNPTRFSHKGPVPVSQDEEMTALVDFENGSTGVLQASAVAAGRKNRIAWEINGAKGSLLFDMDDINTLQVYLADSTEWEVIGFTKVNVTQMDRNHPFADIWWPRGHGIGWEHAHINEIAHFLDAIAQDISIAPYGATFADGYRVAAVIEAIEESSRTGRTVEPAY